jgi:hypothetical protein
LTGVFNTGADGIAGNAEVVVKLHTDDQPLVPPAFVAFTRQ